MTERFEYPDDREAHNAARVRALEALLIEKGVITHATVDKIMDVFTTEMGPFNGAKLVARAWVDPAFKDLLVNDTMAAVAQFGFPKSGGAEGEHMRLCQYAGGSQPHHLHPLLLLSLAGAWSPALLVQGPLVQGAGGARAAQGAQGVRPRGGPLKGDPDVGQQRADPLVCRARTAERKVSARRACCLGDAGGHDGCRGFAMPGA